MRIVQTFDVYRFKRSKNLRCPNCGVKVHRTRTFEGTCNPYTKPPWMTEAQMAEKLAPKMAEWQERAELCTPCRKAAD